jgi:radical SAM superfamily enzyme YgiQ (UPF0313 family)
MKRIADGATQMQNRIKEKNSHLIAIDFMLMISTVLNDWGKFLSQNSMSGMFQELLKYVLDAMGNLLKEQARWSEALIQEFLAHLRSSVVWAPVDLPKGLSTELRGMIEQWINMLKAVIGDDMVWTMLRVSFERIISEQKFYGESEATCDVVLANPPWVQGMRKGVRAGSRWPFTVETSQRVPDYIPFPFWLAYATALLKSHGYRVQLIDAIAEGLTDEEFLERVRGLSPRIIFLETAAPSFHVDMSFARQLKHALPKSVVVMGGPIVSSHGIQLMRQTVSVDYMIAKEYEVSLLYLTNALLKGQGSLDTVPGLIYQTRDRGIAENPQSLVDINALPWPERESLPIYNYQDLFAGMRFPMANLMASRGCPYDCDFCVWVQAHYNDHRYRIRDVNDVAREAKWLCEKFGMKALFFDDDTFNIGRRRIEQLCEAFRSEGITVPWAIMGRADGSPRDVLEKMKEAGLVSVKFGVESGNQDLVLGLGKRLLLDSVREAVNNCKDVGILVHLTFTLGVSGETAESLEQTIRFALELDPDSIQFSINTPFPGTPAFTRAEASNLIRIEEWQAFDGSHSAVVDYENVTREQLQSALERAYLLFNNQKREKSNILYQKKPLSLS